MHNIALMIIVGIILSISLIMLIMICSFEIRVRVYFSIDRRLLLIVVEVAGVSALHFVLKLIKDEVQMIVNGKRKEIVHSSIGLGYVSKMLDIISKNVEIRIYCSTLLAINNAMDSAIICGILQFLPNNRAYFSAKGEGIEVDLRVYGKLNLINAMKIILKSKKIKSI